MTKIITKIIVARQNGEILGQFVLGAGEFLIGREPECDIYVEDQHVSRKHARLSIGEESIEIEDLGSSSGTYLDGVPIKGRIPLRPSQKVHISDLYIDIERQGNRELVPAGRLSDGKYTLISKLGQGSMGAVWLAQDEVKQRQVALKFLPYEMAGNSAGISDLRREVQKTQFLNHENILAIEGLIAEAGEPPFIVLEYVDGANLHELRCLQPNRMLPFEYVRAYMLQLCSALEYAHDRKIAHRDIKPANLMVNRQGQLKLADFGIAASMSTTVGTLTSSVLGAGTPSYMSPQQIQGRRPQATDDIYSLGATFYDLITGTPPFYQGDIVHQVLKEPAMPPQERLRELGVKNDVPDYVAALVMACLQKDSAKRPPTAAAVRQWIEEAKVDFGKHKRLEWGPKPETTLVPKEESPKPKPSTAKQKTNPTEVKLAEVGKAPHVRDRVFLRKVVPAGVLLAVAVLGFYGIAALLFPKKNGKNSAVEQKGSTNAVKVRVVVSAEELKALADKRMEWSGLAMKQAGVPQANITQTLTEGGTVVVWGDNFFGQTNVPAGLNGVVAVAAGGFLVVALKKDGTVVTWGRNDRGQTVPEGLNGVLAIAAGYDHIIALKSDGTVAAWGGNNGSGQISVPTGLKGVVAIAAGGFHSVALKSDGTVVAWGEGKTVAKKGSEFGQAIVPNGLNDVVAITAGSFHTVALKKDGTIVSWGKNEYGVTDVPAGLNYVVAIAAGTSHTVALKGDGTVARLGANWGKVPAGLKNVVAIAAGHAHSMAAKNDGTVAVWGQNKSDKATVPAGLSGVVAMEGGNEFTVALRLDNFIATASAGTTNAVKVPGVVPLRN